MMHGNYPKKTCAFLNDLGCTNEVIEDYYRSLVGLRTRIHSTPPYAPNPEEYYMKCSDGTNIFVQEFIPEEMNSLVLMQHGNQCQGDLYYPVADHLYPNGIGVICVDNRGHGRSGPKRGILSEPQLMCGIY